MDVLDAAVRVLREEARPLHWTVIQDLALKRGYLDPFVQTDIRTQLQRALLAAVRHGELVRTDVGVYELPP
jgi:hypothetical protein